MKSRSHVAHSIARRAALALLLSGLLIALAGSGWGQASADPAVEKSLTVGASEVLNFQGITRAVVADPTIADYVVLSAKQIMITARAPGATDFYVWDQTGQHTFRLTVAAAPSRIAEVVQQIAQAIGDPAIKVSEHNGVIILEGEVPAPYAAQRAEAIAAAYAPKVSNLIQVRAVQKPALDLEQIQAALGPGVTVRALTDGTLLLEGTATPEQKARLDQIVKALGTQVAVVNLVSAPAYAPRQIVVHVKVVDVDRSALSEIGIDWGGLTEEQVFERDAFGNIISQSIRLRPHDQPIILGELFEGPFALDEAGPIRRLEALSARLKALVTDNKARVLAEPNLLVREGETANMLVGGEIPIPVVQTAVGTATATTGAVSVEWKEFGVKLEIMGTIGPDGRSIDLEVTPEVSSLDFGNAIVVSNILLPALRTRRAHSVVHIGDGQTLVIGGLYQSEWSTSVRKVPLLGDIPILGELFKRTDRQQRNTELMIFVTPEIVTEASAAARTAAALEQAKEEN